MAVYAVGDIQGCCTELEALLDTLNFDPASDQLWSVGDLVNRGPRSLDTLRLIKSLGPAVRLVLGNHDLHLLACALTEGGPVADASLAPVLAAPDRDELIDWLRQQPLAVYDAKLDTLLVHAGVAPGWTLTETLARAGEVSAALLGPGGPAFLAAMYGARPARWDERLSGQDRLRFITNSLTRIRYCTVDGELDFDAKLAPGTQPEGLLPWFDLPGRQITGRIVFGHWSTLGFLKRQGLLALDTGCVWGGTLTAMRLDADEPPVSVASLQPRVFGKN